MVADERYRETLYQLDQTIQKIRGKLGETDETVALAGHYQTASDVVRDLAGRFIDLVLHC
jgi:predicted 2-oxoglutarate/Fe(II)-dependent dioxygenase YbiX